MVLALPARAVGIWALRLTCLEPIRPLMVALPARTGDMGVEAHLEPIRIRSRVLDSLRFCYRGLLIRERCLMWEAGASSGGGPPRVAL